MIDFGRMPLNARPALSNFRFGAIFTAALVAFCCSMSCRVESEGRSTENNRFILLAIDGADWKVIEWMWAEGRMPNFRRLADQGVAVPLHTFHHASPVIWTTVATGVMPSTHGITEFVVPTGKGDQPVSSGLRRVPALWNMVSAAGKRVAVIGWWASWPAEEVNGVIISDRAVHDIDDRVSPAGFLPEFERWAEEALAPGTPLGAEVMLEADRILAHAAVNLASEDFDLIMLYLRGVDISSHFNWRYFEPENFPEEDPSEIDARRELIAREYDFADRALGALLERAGTQANVLVVSDHGFDAMDEERLNILLNFDAVLEDLGFLVRTGEGVDFASSSLYCYDSPDRTLGKKVRFVLAGREPGGAVTERETAALRLRLETRLAAVTFTGGAAAFEVRDASSQEREQGADFVVEVLTAGAKAPLRIEGIPIRGALRSVNHLSGTHGRKTPGILIAAGPDIESPSEPQKMRVVDVPPTVLYAMGLPVADNFVGRPLTEIFEPGFRNRNPVHRIESWGEPRAGEGRSSEVDDELLQQLRALGYID
jgi:predicted AlkP superfamily phosphohydrolase/phosphomutase